MQNNLLDHAHFISIHTHYFVAVVSKLGGLKCIPIAFHYFEMFDLNSIFYIINF